MDILCYQCTAWHLHNIKVIIFCLSSVQSCTIILFVNQCTSSVSMSSEHSWCFQHLRHLWSITVELKTVCNLLSWWLSIANNIIACQYWVGNDHPNILHFTPPGNCQFQVTYRSYHLTFMQMNTNVTQFALKAGFILETLGNMFFLQCSEYSHQPFSDTFQY